VGNFAHVRKNNPSKYSWGLICHEVQQSTHLFGVCCIVCFS
jgi:hypothetical protein